MFGNHILSDDCLFRKQTASLLLDIFFQLMLDGFLKQFTNGFVAAFTTAW
jgi:hypothetical protein